MINIEDTTINVRKQKDEVEILELINNMDEVEKKQFRKVNEEHNKVIAERTVRNFFSRILKRTIDIIAGIIGTIILIPLTLVVWILRKINKEEGPLFYDQLRIGEHGKIFKLYKFRSMVIGADKKLGEYLATHPEEAEEYRINKKLENDPRVTKTGKILRRLSLDEWPQFLNILFGQMSLIGPRPYLPREREDMGEYYDYIIKVRPGLTGPWQIAGRSNITFEDRLKLDEEYASRCGNRRDLKILLKSFKIVFSREGAK